MGAIQFQEYRSVCQATQKLHSILKFNCFLRPLRMLQGMQKQNRTDS